MFICIFSLYSYPHCQVCFLGLFKEPAFSESSPTPKGQVSQGMLWVLGSTGNLPLWSHWVGLFPSGSQSQILTHFCLGTTLAASRKGLNGTFWHSFIGHDYYWFFFKSCLVYSFSTSVLYWLCITFLCLFFFFFLLGRCILLGSAAGGCTIMS